MRRRKSLKNDRTVTRRGRATYQRAGDWMVPGRRLGIPQASSPLALPAGAMATHFEHLCSSLEYPHAPGRFRHGQLAHSYRAHGHNRGVTRGARLCCREARSISLGVPTLGLGRVAPKTWNSGGFSFVVRTRPLTARTHKRPRVKGRASTPHRDAPFLFAHAPVAVALQQDGAEIAYRPLHPTSGRAYRTRAGEGRKFLSPCGTEPQCGALALGRSSYPLACSPDSQGSASKPSPFGPHALAPVVHASKRAPDSSEGWVAVGCPMTGQRYACQSAGKRAADEAGSVTMLCVDDPVSDIATSSFARRGSVQGGGCLGICRLAGRGLRA